MKRFLSFFLVVLMIFAAMPVSFAEGNNDSEPVDIPVIEEIAELGSPDSTAILTEETAQESTEETTGETIAESAEEPTAQPTVIPTEEDLIEQDPSEAGFAYSLRAADTLEITAHPVSVRAKSGASVSFTVSATGSNLSYQWQTQEVGKTTWVDTGMAGNRTAKLSFTTGVALDGRKYRCAVSDGSKIVYSNPATLTLTDVLKVTEHPASVSAKTGDTVSFSVSAKGSNLSYQWQMQEVGKTTWVDTGMAGNKTAKLSFTTGSALDGRQYRCAVSDGSKIVYSNPATLTLTDVFKVTEHPASVSAKTGDTVSFSVSAKGSNLSYQWQTLEVGKTTWVNTGMAGNRTAKLSFTTGSALDGRQYRCAVSDGSKTVYSNPATLTLTDVFKVTEHPASVSAKTGDTVSFSVSAKGSNLSYQWQTLEVGKTTWVNTGMAGNRTAKLSFTTGSALDGRQYRCAVSDGSKTVYSNPATLTLTNAIHIISNPVNVNVKTGESASFAVSAKGSNLSYQWQTLVAGTTDWVNTGMAGNKTEELFFRATEDLDGSQYRCVVSNGSNTEYSDPATLTLTNVLKITTNPENVSARSGDTVSFTVSAKGSNLSYQWQTLAVGSTDWVNTLMSGYKTAKLSIKTTAALDGQQYRCAVSNGSKTEYSDPATLTLTDALKITSNPANVSAKSGDTVSFTVSAQGSNLKYQWQTLKVGTSNWVNTGMVGNQTAEISFKTAAVLDGRQYRCAVSDGSKTVYSDPATLTLSDGLKITANPANVSAKSGDTVNFTVSAQGSSLSYQWQTLKVGTTDWVNTEMKGNKTATLSFKTAAVLDGRQYRCAISDGNKTVYSDPATLTLSDVLITSHPINISAKIGTTVSFTVSAKGSNLSYQWQTRSTGTNEWVNAGMAGSKTARLSFRATEALDGQQYRCVVSNGSKTEYSNPATLTLTNAIHIISNPVNVNVKTGESASFAVSAKGSNLSYQWQTQKVGTTDWVNTGMVGNQTAEISFKTAAVLDGRQYRCAISDGNTTIYSDPATLTLSDVLKITANPANVSAKSGDTVSFTVSAQGSNLKYQWQTQKVGTTDWVNTGMGGNQTAEISFKTAAVLDGRQYRCAVSDGSTTVYSDSATLTLSDVLKITANPANVSAKSGDTVSFTVSAQGSNLKYQWQTLKVGTSNWVNTGMVGNQTAEISFKTAAFLDGRQYRCAASDGSKTVYSNPAMLTLTDVTDGKKTNDQYDDQGNYLGKKVSYTDANGKVVEEHYNAQGYYTGKSVTVYEDAEGRKTIENYDAQGNLIRKYISYKDADGKCVQENYDTQGNYTGKYVSYKGTNGEDIEEQYNTQGKLTVKYTTGANGKCIQENYDAQGHCTMKTVSYTNTEGKQTVESYDAQGNYLGKVVSYTSADGETIQEEHDSQNLLMYTYTTDTEGKTKTEKYFYNESKYAGKHIFYTDVSGKQVQEIYDAKDNLKQKTTTDADGKETIEYYDDDGHLENKYVSYIDANGKENHIWYDGQGNLISKDVSYTDADGKEIVEYYDAQGIYTGKDVCYRDADGKYTVEYYDAEDNLIDKHVS